MAFFSLVSNIRSIIPWRLRQFVDRAGGKAKNATWRTLRRINIAPASKVDLQRPWPIPRPTICEVEGISFRSLFRLSEYDSEAMQEITRSLQCCADATGTTLDRSKRWEIPVLLVGSGIQQSDVCLDVGCGSSCLPVWLDGVGCEVYAIDPEMHAVSNQWSLPTSRIHVNGNFINYLRRSMTHLPFRNDMFDHVFCVSVIEHLPPGQIAAGLQEMIRVTKPGGTIGISTDVYPANEGSISKNHAHVFNLTELRREILDHLSEMQPVSSIDLSIEEGMEKHLADLKATFNARHSFFSAVWRKP